MIKLPGARARRWFYPGGLIFLLMMAFHFTVFQVAAQDTGVRIGAVAPDFTLTDLRGNRVGLREIAGRNRATVLNFWASWSPPCRREIAELVQFYRQYGYKAGVIAVNLQEDPNTVRQFARNNGMDFPVLTDLGGDAAALYQVYAIPTTFILDRDGVIRQILPGGKVTLAVLKARVDSF